jgi:hypothetical protein
VGKFRDRKWGIFVILDIVTEGADSYRLAQATEGKGVVPLS